MENEKKNQSGIQKAPRLQCVRHISEKKRKIHKILSKTSPCIACLMLMGTKNVLQSLLKSAHEKKPIQLRNKVKITCTKICKNAAQIVLCNPRGDGPVFHDNFRDSTFKMSKLL